MREIMYDVSSIVIAVSLFVSMVVAMEIGFRLGRRHQDRTSEVISENSGAIQASMLGILALLLGFTFSLALNRHDERSQAVVNEANAIGTAWLRTQLLPEPFRPEIRGQMQLYVDLRMEAALLDMTRQEERDQLLLRTDEAIDQLWSHAAAAAAQEPNPVTTGLFLQALNEMFDAFGSRDAALARHVPEMVLFLLYGTFLMTGCVMGFTAGLAGQRNSFATYILTGLIVILVFIIIDLDRPRRGLIEINQQSLISLHAKIMQAKDSNAIQDQRP